MIDPIDAVSQVLSYYTRVTSDSQKVEVTQVRHIDIGGTTKVEEISFRTYNKHGEEVEANKTGTKVDSQA